MNRLKNQEAVDSFVRSAAARANRGASVDHPLPEEPCVCSCSVRRDAKTGRLRSSGDCSCERVVGLRNGDGGPKVVTEPCTPERRQARRLDAREVASRLAEIWRAHRDMLAANAWRTVTRTDATTRATKTRSRMTGAVAGVDLAARTVDIIASTGQPVEGERLTTWDLERYQKNPAILWGHDMGALPIGTAEEIEQAPGGLRMRVRLASKEANPLAEQVLLGAHEGIVRAVSVGFERGEGRELPDGTTERSAELLEVSFVAVGKDEDAGTSALNPDAASDQGDEHDDETDEQRGRSEDDPPPDAGDEEQRRRGRHRSEDEIDSENLRDPDDMNEQRVDARDGAPLVTIKMWSRARPRSEGDKLQNDPSAGVSATLPEGVGYCPVDVGDARLMMEEEQRRDARDGGPLTVEQARAARDRWAANTCKHGRG